MNDQVITHPGQPVTVHKSGEEGTIQIDNMTGQVITTTDERPDWADGIYTAMLVERHGFYGKRLGPAYTEEMKSPETFEFDDLSWIGLDAEGDEVEIEADAEHRMSNVATTLGIDLEDFDQSTNFSNALADVEMDLRAPSHGDDIQLLDDATKESFGGRTEDSQEGKATVTG